MTTLTEGFPCFFLSCKANARVKPRKDGAWPALFLVCCVALCIFLCSLYFCVLCIVCFVTFPVLFVCICVLNNCHWVATQLQLNVSYLIQEVTQSKINNQLTFMMSLLLVSASTRPIIRVAVHKGIQTQLILWKMCIIPYLYSIVYSHADIGSCRDHSM